MTGAEIRIGDAVVVRGAAWTVTNVARWPDCGSLDLISRGAAPAPRTLLVPFDRPRRLDPGVTRRTVGIRRALHALRALQASMVPFGGLRTLAESNARLLPHQLAPALAMLRHGETRVLIADAVGLGKTIQAGIVVRELQAGLHELRALVLVPAGLRHQWGEELESHFAVRAVHASSAWLREVARDRPPDLNPWSLPGVYLASHDFVKRPEVLRALDDVAWDLVVVDEAHAATIGSDRRVAIDSIAQRSRRVLLLTATPHAGDAREFEALCNLGRVEASEPGILMFQRSRAELTGTPARRTRFLPIEPTSAEVRMHDLLDRYAGLVWREAGGRGDARAQLVAFVLKKRALSSAAALAASATRRLELLSIPQAAASLQLQLPLHDEEPLADGEPDALLATPGLADPRLEKRWLGTIVEVARRAAACESKLQRLRSLVRRIGQPLIVFSEYRDTLRMLEHALRSDGRQLVILHGGMSPSERAEAQRRFNGGGSVLLATDAASEGLNLHHRCRLAVHYELPWSPARLEQRAGRVDRLGQTERVHEIALVSSLPAERLVLAPLAARLTKAATVAPSSAAMLACVTESSVGRTIMAAAPLTLEAGAPPPATTVRMSDRAEEAVEECRRLEERRRWLAVSAGRTAPSGVRSWRRGAAQSRGCFFIVELSFVDASRGPVHSEAVVLRLAVAKNAGANRSERLRWAEAAWRSDAVQRVLDGLLAELTARAGWDHAAAGAALRLREQAIERATFPGARELVQAGLFDRRNIRAAASRPLVGLTLGDAHPDRQARSQRIESPPEAVATLRSVILGGREGPAA